MEKETNRLPYAIEGKNPRRKCRLPRNSIQALSDFVKFFDILIALPLTNAPRQGIIKTEDDTACGFQKLHRRSVS